MAVALFRGPMHVLEYADEDVLRLSPRDGRGIPVREAFPEEAYIPVQAAMDECFRSGETLELQRLTGSLILVPRRDGRGRVFGVATHFEAAPAALHPQPVRSLQARDVVGRVSALALAVQGVLGGPLLA